MKITVVGLGAVGGLLAARLAEAGHEVQALARGATLAALRRNGLTLTGSDGRARRVPLAAHDDARALAPAPLLLIALKGPGLTALAPQLAPLVARDKPVVLPMMNGVPWWFLMTPPASQRLSAAEQRLSSVDPGGVIEAALPLELVLGGVVHLTSSSPAPGHVKHGFGERLIVGEPLGEIKGVASARVASVVEVLKSAGFAAEASADLRRELWYKLWGNMTMNPVSALTGAACDAILDDELVRGFMAAAMAEAAAIGDQLGCPIAQSAEERMAVTRQLGAFKTSMLQDAEAGRPLELDALVAAVHQIGERVGVPTPNIASLLGLTRLMARTRGLVTGG